MQTIPFRAVGVHDIKLAEQGHPPGWRSPAGGDYDLVVVGGGRVAGVRLRTPVHFPAPGDWGPKMDPSHPAGLKRGQDRVESVARGRFAFPLLCIRSALPLWAAG